MSNRAENEFLRAKQKNRRAENEFLRNRNEKLRLRKCLRKYKKRLKYGNII